MVLKSETPIESSALPVTELVAKGVSIANQVMFVGLSVRGRNGSCIVSFQYLHARRGSEHKSIADGKYHGAPEEVLEDPRARRAPVRRPGKTEIIRGRIL